MDVLVLIGRILFVVLFLGSALGHLTRTKEMAGYAASRGLPMATAATFGSGLLLLAGGVSVAVGLWADLGALALAAFCIPTAVLMHAFWKESTPQAKQLEQTMFLKDIALGGAALVMFAFFAYAGHDLGLMVTAPFCSIS
ncbi:DoxX family membrane protein [Streptomyces sp. NPDC090022]|uniref:DoxX family membrane protein n=1 Tax=Streptomyces sp. NPDC090022 TaxID=3365920 RepID=UPI0038249294